MSAMLRTSDRRVLEIVAEGKERVQLGREKQQQIADQKRIKGLVCTNSKLKKGDIRYLKQRSN